MRLDQESSETIERILAAEKTRHGSEVTAIEQRIARLREKLNRKSRRYLEKVERLEEARHRAALREIRQAKLPASGSEKSSNTEPNSQSAQPSADERADAANISRYNNWPSTAVPEARQQTRHVRVANGSDATKAPTGSHESTPRRRAPQRHRLAGVFTALREAVAAQPGAFTATEIREYLEKRFPHLDLEGGKRVARGLYQLANSLKTKEIELVAEARAHGNKLNIYRRVHMQAPEMLNLNVEHRLTHH